ncbi:hypothetical protein [Halomonas saccharevitans]|uniref:Uncharacterized protein n=1 Tax=Halomonas saccharevitans TaxID=416872 RepID=A0A1I7AP63_9GAMM|nr:hypothetical protein [Halomonas saccharevitans]SFT76717.1 hypothetical protein SAMN04487956_11911 [Halomonas saccharevitans]
MIKTPASLLMAAALTVPSLAMSDTLELPIDATLDVQVIETLTLTAQEPAHDDLIIHPVAGGSASHSLPEYCVVVGNARLDGERIRLTTQALTCIETDGSESEIYSGELSAAAYGADGDFGIPACQGGECRLTPQQTFQLRLASDLAIEQQDNPAAEINAQRRQGEGTANPTPAETGPADD